jgi:replication factor A1
MNADSHNNRGATTSTRQHIPIDAVFPGRKEYCFKARIIDKSTPHNWNNNKGQGTMFNITFMDSNGSTMSGRFFTEGYKAHFDKINVGKIYELSGFKIQVPQRTSSTTSEYEATFDQNSTILELVDDGLIPAYSIKNVVNLENVAKDKDINASRDYLVIIHSAKPAIPYTTKKGSESHRRDLVVIDKAGWLVEVTFWGDVALKWQDDQFQPGKPVLLQGLRINEWNGARSLQSGFGSSCTFNLQDQKSLALAQWYKTADQNSFKSLKESTRTDSGADPNAPKRVWTRDRFSDVDEDEFKSNQDPHNAVIWLHIDGYVSRINAYTIERFPWYDACKGLRDGKPCAKKVVLSGDHYHCDGCGSTLSDCQPRYILSAFISDESGSKMVSFFNDQAEAVVGYPASELKSWIDPSDPDSGIQRINEHFASLCNREIALSLRVGLENGTDGQIYVRYRCHKVEPVDERWDKLSQFAIAEIKHFKAVNAQYGA